MGELDALRERIDRLERGQRRWRQLAICVCLVLALPVAVAATQEPGELKARGLTIVDRTGIPRLVLGATSNSSRITFLDGDGKPRMAMKYFESEGYPILVMSDSGGDAKLELLLSAGTTPQIQLKDHDEKERLIIRSNWKDGRGEIEFRKATGQVTRTIN
jgi:hypothetical protein